MKDILTNEPKNDVTDVSGRISVEDRILNHKALFFAGIVFIFVFLFGVSIIAGKKSELQTYKITNNGKILMSESKDTTGRSGYDDLKYNKSLSSGLFKSDSMLYTNDVAAGAMPDMTSDGVYYNAYDSGSDYYETEGSVNDTEYDPGYLYADEIQAAFSDHSSKYLIRDIDTDIETEKYDEYVKYLLDQLVLADGYVYDSYSDSRSYYDYQNIEHRVRMMDLTLRVPAAKTNDFCNVLDDLDAFITYQKDKISDVSKSYNDISYRKQSLESEKEKLLALLDQAESIRDILDIEEKLSDIDYELQYSSRQLSDYDEKIEYSTLNISVYEVDYIKITADTFRSDLIEAWYYALVSILESLPYIIMVLLIIAAAVWILMAPIKIIIKSVKNRPTRLLLEYSDVNKDGVDHDLKNKNQTNV